jgi:hypothetical protein
VRHFSRFLRSGLPDSPQLGIQLLRGRRWHPHLENFPLVDSYQTGFAEKVGAEAAPAPQFRRRHQTALYRIAVHVAQFLDALVFGPHVEVVESLLPDMLRRVLEEDGLRRVATASRLRQDPPGKAEFESLHHGRRILLLRLADQQMNMLGHDHVADDDERIALAHLFQHRQKKVAAARSAEHRLPAITTASDEM